MTQLSVKNDFAAETRNRKQFSLLKCAMKEKGPQQQQQRRRQLMKRTFGVCARAIQKHTCRISLNSIYIFTSSGCTPGYARDTKTFVFTSSASE